MENSTLCSAMLRMFSVEKSSVLFFLNPLVEQYRKKCCLVLWQRDVKKKFFFKKTYRLTVFLSCVTLRCFQLPAAIYSLQLLQSKRKERSIIGSGLKIIRTLTPHCSWLTKSCAKPYSQHHRVSLTHKSLLRHVLLFRQWAKPHQLRTHQHAHL
jgi:hypothetical protein